MLEVEVELRQTREENVRLLQQVNEQRQAGGNNGTQRAPELELRELQETVERLEEEAVNWKRRHDEQAMLREANVKMESAEESA